MVSFLPPEERDNWINAFATRNTEKLDQLISTHIKAGLDWTAVSEVADLYGGTSLATSGRYMVSEGIDRVLDQDNPIRAQIERSNLGAAGAAMTISAVSPDPCAADAVRIPIAPSIPSNSAPFDPRIAIVPLVFDYAIIDHVLNAMIHATNIDIPQPVSVLENPQAVSVSVNTISSLRDFQKGLNEYSVYKKIDDEYETDVKKDLDRGRQLYDIWTRSDREQTWSRENSDALKQYIAFESLQKALNPDRDSPLQDHHRMAVTVREGGWQERRSSIWPHMECLETIL